MKRYLLCLLTIIIFAILPHGCVNSEKMAEAESSAWDAGFETGKEYSYDQAFEDGFSFGYEEGYQDGARDPDEDIWMDRMDAYLWGFETFSCKDSSAIIRIGYNEEDQHLLVIFKESGIPYIYYPVTKEVFEAFLNSDSKGKFYNENIKDKLYIGNRLFH